MDLWAQTRLKLYFEVLHLHPIDLTVSFKYMALQEAKEEDDEVRLTHLPVALHGVGVAVKGQTEDAFTCRAHFPALGPF